MLKIAGWRVVGDFPCYGKFVAAVAPHTSNWDFIIAIAVKLALDVKIQFLGKHSLFVGPLGWLLKGLGGIPVDRSSAHGVVDQVSQIFASQPTLILGLAPEGTRKYTSQWRTGFIFIAQQAQVPIVPMAIDYSNKTFVVMEPITDPHKHSADEVLRLVKSRYSKSMAKYPTKVSGL
ncbi:1-acyl-sn-glycerol-3-phosphate acyltransferase (plasmid) [Pseudoalteromonas sp. T1lg65]|uniref:1-acyl-sn-glycerol-3-phosphate acyltransferase n=1 Tax=Pseudoalteromonas sp. T1lg65 TaxID=2077101 RepID=UPI003F793EBF